MCFHTIIWNHKNVSLVRKKSVTANAWYMLMLIEVLIMFVSVLQI